MILTLFAVFAAQDLVTEKTADAVAVKSAGKPLAVYQFVKPADSKLSIPNAAYVHPFATPKGVVVTDVAPDDHKHHRGIFLAWVEMHGKKDADFWGWGQYAPVKDRLILNRAAEAVDAGFRIRNDWTAEGETLVQEQVEGKVRIDGTATVLDLIYTLTADADMKLSKWAFSGFCLRARKDGKATVEGPEGEVKLPGPHHLKPESNWPAHPWYAYAMTLPDGSQAGAAVIDHPKNPQATWHNAASIRMLNPCIVAPGDVVLKAAHPQVLRYRCVAWDGPIDRPHLARLASW